MLKGKNGIQMISKPIEHKLKLIERRFMSMQWFSFFGRNLKLAIFIQMRNSYQEWSKWKLNLKSMRIKSEFLTEFNWEREWKTFACLCLEI